jgi:hypothetical protein
VANRKRGAARAVWPACVQVHAATHTAGEQCEALLVLDGKQGPVPVGSVECEQVAGCCRALALH